MTSGIDSKYVFSLFVHIFSTCLINIIKGNQHSLLRNHLKDFIFPDVCNMKKSHQSLTFILSLLSSTPLEKKSFSIAETFLKLLTFNEADVP